MTEDRRGSVLCRDLNDLVRSPDGKVSEAKAGVVLFKGAMLYVFLNYTTEILSEWSILMLFVAAFIAPDLLKKIIATRIPK